uniref:Fic/DOC family protein n=1 Tax=Pararhizobium sp. IMCC3301 TaxID=3067904 RepID=UPI002740FF0A|nr:Fic family protein [Pararhizobium sp. IMCC3301]
MSDTRYCYPPDYTVLINKLDLRDASQLERAERRLVVGRSLEEFPNGDFDLAHLQAIHRHLFQDIYDWAGDIRDTEISKGGSQFQFRQYIETGMADVHRRIRSHAYLKNLSSSAFADIAGEIIGDINYVHPFREGNGRTQMHYLKQLCAEAGHSIDLTLIEKRAWMDASRQAHLGDYQPMSQCIAKTIIPSNQE